MTPPIRHAPREDLLAAPWRTALLFGLPSFVIAATSVTIRSPVVTFDIDGPIRGAIWAASMGAMAGACLVNALHCGRVHCYFTGPFFLLTAVWSLAYGLGLTPMGASGWAIIGTVTLAGAVILTWLPEAVLGKYRRGPASP
jgi:hypothetical protein